MIATLPLVGGIDKCLTGLPTVHAAKHPCHWRASGGWQLKPEESGYLSITTGTDLYLNMIDGEEHYFRPEIFRTALAFIEAHDGAVQIHCNQGKSRAPSIALLYLAKRGVIPSSSYAAAAGAYLDLNPDYQPGPGIAAFLTHQWAEL